jgi:hypothetical protein
VNQTAATSPVNYNTHADQDANANKAIREVASTPSAQHIIPAEIVAGLYRHVDQMRAEFFAGQLPEVVLSFEVTDKRTLGHYVIRRNGLGVRRNINLNPVHFARPLYHILATLLHELAHAWQHEHGTPSKPLHHNREFREVRGVRGPDGRGRTRSRRAPRVALRGLLSAAWRRVPRGARDRARRRRRG